MILSLNERIELEQKILFETLESGDVKFFCDKWSIYVDTQTLACQRKVTYVRCLYGFFRFLGEVSALADVV
jgi:phage terminase small subunit